MDKEYVTGTLSIDWYILPLSDCRQSVAACRSMLQFSLLLASAWTLSVSTQQLSAAADASDDSDVSWNDDNDLSEDLCAALLHQHTSHQRCSNR